VEKAIATAEGIPAHQPASWQKVERQEIQETQAIRGLLEEGKTNGKNS